MKSSTSHRAASPVAKVEDIAWIELEKPDIVRAAAFAEAFGFVVASHDASTLVLRGALAGAPCLIVRRASRPRFVGVAFRATRAGVARLASAHGASAMPREDGGVEVMLVDPAGVAVRVVADVPVLPALVGQAPLPLNVGREIRRTNVAQRPPREPARVERLGHLVLETPSFLATLAWYEENLGLIVSDFLYLADQEDRGPIMAFLRCDRGETPTDHHTLALVLGPASKYVHSAYQVADLDAIAAGGEHLKEQGYRHAWGIGRHIEGSQLFDYWRDPDGLMFEHFADGDLFDASVPAGWTPLRASGLSQWGPPVTKDFLEARPTPGKIRDVVRALRDPACELDLERLRGLMKALGS